MPRQIKWVKERHGVSNTVLIETVSRFKGLESPIIFLWVNEEIKKSKYYELLYVGISRAKSRLYIVGTHIATSFILDSDS
ncbi:MAG: ATP-binding domain-containing protein [Desulfamplus sp.]|nr:ATP-binding domain-containing protein [Desulfamplus sp.]